jgi:cyclopropane-fatty-acyl-phospholipid synthase
MSQSTVSRSYGQLDSLPVDSGEVKSIILEPHTAAGGSAGESTEGLIPSSASPGFRGEKLAVDLLTRVFRRFPGTVWLRLWTGAPFRVGGRHDPADATLAKSDEALGQADGTSAVSLVSPAFVIAFRNPQAVAAIVLSRDPLRLADLYFSGAVDIEGDFFAALGLRNHLQTIKLTVADRIGAMFSALRLKAMNAGATPAADAPPSHAPSSFDQTVVDHSRSENRAAVQFHYDVSNEFYALWLDCAMVYSCAYFERSEVALDEAQMAKLEHICRKLMLKPGEMLLDIGCGWGALVIHAAKHYGVRAHGITLSAQQYALALERVKDAGLEDRVAIELLDYRDLPGEAVYDKVSSIGMFEHVGIKNLSTYFSTVERLLKPAGLFLNHGITHEYSESEESLPIEFINRYVFPDGQLDTVGNIQRVMESSRFEITDVEGLRPHYALTLRSWVRNLERRHARALEYVNEATYRVWRLYMAACALEFESGSLGLYQIVASKRSTTTHPELPLTRRHLYCQTELDA